MCFTKRSCADGKANTKTIVLNDFEYIGKINGERRWRSDGGKRIYTWDSLHGEIEVFNGRGKHLGAVDPQTGKMKNSAVPGRTIDV